MQKLCLKIWWKAYIQAFVKIEIPEISHQHSIQRLVSDLYVSYIFRQIQFATFKIWYTYQKYNKWWFDNIIKWFTIKISQNVY